MRIRTWSLLLAAVLPAALTGCSFGPAGPIEPQSGGEHTHPTGSTDVVVDVRLAGGLVPQEIALDDRPRFRLYGDGTVLVRADEGRFPALDIYRLSDEGIQVVLRAAVDAGIAYGERDFGIPDVSDAPYLTLTVALDGQSSLQSVVAPWFDVEAGLTDGQRDAREDLLVFLETLETIPQTEQELLVEPSRRYDGAIDVHAWPADGLGGGADVSDWPLEPSLPLTGLTAEGFDGDTCGTLAVDDAPLLRAALAADPAAVWTSGGRTWRIGLRAVLPGERGCSEPAAAEVRGDGYHGYRMAPDLWATPEGSQLALGATPSFQPSEADVAAVEAALPAGLRWSLDPQAEAILARLGEYVRQYVGVERQGQRLVLVNALCDTTGSDAARAPVLVLDGGACYWRGLVDPGTGDLVALAVNGAA